MRGLGFADKDLDRSLNTFSGGELTRASLARSLGGDPDLVLLDEPTNHLDVESLEWLERELTTIDAAVDAGRARPLVPRGGHERDDGAGRRALHLLRRAVARLAAGEGRARAPRAEDGGACGRRHRAPRTLRRAVPLQEVEGQAGPGEDHAHRPPREGARRRERRGRAAHAPHPLARVRLPEAAALGPHGDRGEGTRRRRRATSRCSPTRASRWSAASTSRSSARTARGRRPCWRRCSTAASPRPARRRPATAS